MFFGWAYPFFPLFILWLPIDVCHTVFIIVKYVFSSCWECGTENTLFPHKDSGFFLCPMLGTIGTKEKNSKRKKPSSKLQSFLFKFCNFSMENLVLDQLTISLYMVFFIPITCLLDIVRRNSVFVTHKSERVISHCRWPSLTWSHLSFYCEVSSHWYQRTSLWVVQLGSTVCVGQNSGQVYSDKGYEQEVSTRPRRNIFRS